MGTFTIDDSRWPIVVHTVEGVQTDEQIDRYVAVGTEQLLRGEPYVVVMDIRKLGLPSAYARARSAEWARTYREQLQATCRGTVYVVSSPLLRFMTMTVLLIGRLPTPYRVCEDLDEALAWAREQLR